MKISWISPAEAWWCWVWQKYKLVEGIVTDISILHVHMRHHWVTIPICLIGCCFLPMADTFCLTAIYYPKQEMFYWVNVSQVGQKQWWPTESLETSNAYIIFNVWFKSLQVKIRTYTHTLGWFKICKLAKILYLQVNFCSTHKNV